VLLRKRADVCTGQYIKGVDKPLGFVDNKKVICELVAGNGQCFNTHEHVAELRLVSCAARSCRAS
jgi:hypothetical protein